MEASRTRIPVRSPWRRLAAPVVLACLALSGQALGQRQEKVSVIVNGLGGMPEYEENFLQWSEKLERIFQDQLGSHVIRLDGRQQNREAVLAAFRRAADSLAPGGEFWLFLIGHANFDGTRYRFNIRGPDVTDEDLKSLLDSLGSSRAFVVAATSASGALLPALQGPNRVIVTATRSAAERQPPLFLSFFLEAATSVEADTNKDGKVSLLEAYLFTRQKVREWFEERNRIQTEHALLDDRGELVLGQERGQEAPPPTQTALLASLGALSAPPAQAYRTAEAEALARERTRIEREIEDLKFRKGQMAPQDYYHRLEEMLVELARLNERILQLEES